MYYPPRIVHSTLFLEDEIQRVADVKQQVSTWDTDDRTLGTYQGFDVGRENVVLEW